MTKIATDKSDMTILTSDNPKNEDPCMYYEEHCRTVSSGASIVETTMLKWLNLRVCTYVFTLYQWTSWMICWLALDGRCRIT